MLIPTLRSETDAKSWRRSPERLPPIDHFGGFVPALFAGGDSRIAFDLNTGLNKYLCPAVPTPDFVCMSSCTASPISVAGFDRAAAAFLDTIQAPSPRQRAERLTALTEAIEARLLRYFGITALAQAFLCPSGTDALLTTALLIAAERPSEVMTAILPSASETGTGVPMAAVGRLFDGPNSGAPVTESAGKTVEISLRSADGSPRCEDEVNDAFATATAAATGNVIVYLTHGTKTGLIAPVSPPDGADVIVDACQARIAPETVAAYLRRGWPVVVTGSKFFGGPAFSGAVLFPRARPTGGRAAHRFCTTPPGLGTALRWTAALAAIDAFEPLAASMADVLSNRAGDHRTGARVQSSPCADRRPATERLRVGRPAQHFHLWSARSDGSAGGCCRRPNCGRSMNGSRAGGSCSASRSVWDRSAACGSRSAPGTCWTDLVMSGLDASSPLQRALVMARILATVRMTTPIARPATRHARARQLQETTFMKNGATRLPAGSRHGIGGSLQRREMGSIGYCREPGDNHSYPRNLLGLAGIRARHCCSWASCHEAIEMLSKVVKLAPGDADGYNDLGSALH